ncbi:MAG TPA: hypothetical protein PK514_12380 [Spirochaetota bacterium]|nr:hypothetical protein [Spirochaetota bacterium]
MLPVKQLIIGMIRDYEVMDKPDEQDLFGGTILRLGKELGIATPAADFIYAELNKIKPAL